jgi:hypothetical protein
MNNPYAPTIDPVVDTKWKRQIAFNLGRTAVLVMICLIVTYAVSLPSSKMLTKDSALIALSPFIPMGLIAAAIVGETIWALIMTICGFPIIVSVVVGALGVRKKRALVAAVSMGILYGLFLRLFYLTFDFA